MLVIIAEDFVSWRDAARELLLAQIPPEEVIFRQQSAQHSLLTATPEISHTDFPTFVKQTVNVPKEFLSLAEKVACHRDEYRWELLYRILWRLTHGERELLEISVDDDVRQLMLMEKSVRRDVHKMKAFVRFRSIEFEDGEHFVAWHRPDHFIVQIAAPFFMRRFSSMRWSILTPDLCAHWDLRTLSFSPGVPSTMAPQSDVLEEMWKTYYRSIFNPARIKLRAMVKEMPKRHWKTLPETQIIDELLAQAPARVSEMIQRQEGSKISAADYLPESHDYASLKESARECRGCPLYAPATQTVFGVGPVNAKLMLVGEQPGDQEDLQGEPFIGPAGQVLDRVLSEAGLERDKIYLTNAVKHFKFTQKPHLRFHRKPDARETSACKPWVVAEIALIKPKVLVCLGATAAQTLIGRDFKISTQRGQWIKTSSCEMTLATYHPSAVLRMPSAEKREEVYQLILEDFKHVAARMH